MEIINLNLAGSPLELNTKVTSSVVTVVLVLKKRPATKVLLQLDPSLDLNGQVIADADNARVTSNKKFSGKLLNFNENEVPLFDEIDPSSPLLLFTTPHGIFGNNDDGMDDATVTFKVPVKIDVAVLNDITNEKNHLVKAWAITQNHVEVARAVPLNFTISLKKPVISSISLTGDTTTKDSQNTYYFKQDGALSIEINDKTAKHLYVQGKIGKDQYSAPRTTRMVSAGKFSIQLVELLTEQQIALLSNTTKTLYVQVRSSLDGDSAQKDIRLNNYSIPPDIATSTSFDKNSSKFSINVSTVSNALVKVSKVEYNIGGAEVWTALTVDNSTASIYTHEFPIPTDTAPLDLSHGIKVRATDAIGNMIITKALISADLFEPLIVGDSIQLQKKTSLVILPYHPDNIKLPSVRFEVNWPSAWSISNINASIPDYIFVDVIVTDLTLLNKNVTGLEVTPISDDFERKSRAITPKYSIKYSLPVPGFTLSPKEKVLLHTGEVKLHGVFNDVPVKNHLVDFQWKIADTATWYTVEASQIAVTGTAFTLPLEGVDFPDQTEKSITCRAFYHDDVGSVSAEQSASIIIDNSKPSFTHLVLRVEDKNLILSGRVARPTHKVDRIDNVSIDWTGAGVNTVATISDPHTTTPTVGFEGRVELEKIINNNYLNVIVTARTVAGSHTNQAVVLHESTDLIKVSPALNAKLENGNLSFEVPLTISTSLNRLSIYGWFLAADTFHANGTPPTIVSENPNVIIKKTTPNKTWSAMETGSSLIVSCDQIPAGSYTLKLSLTAPNTFKGGKKFVVQLRDPEPNPTAFSQETEYQITVNIT